MSLADDVKPVLFDARGLVGELGFRPYSVKLMRKVWSGSDIGRGSATVTELPIVEAGGQPPAVRFLDDEERALSGMPAGTLEVGPITPEFSGGGYSWATLTAADADVREEVFYVVTGPEFPNGARFNRRGGTSERALGYTLMLAPTALA